MRMGDQKLNLKFVQEVEKREVLYNFNLPGYSRKDVVEKAWQEVSDECNLPVAECREKWRNVRTVFIRKRKPSPKGSKTRRKAYYLADAMKFCLPFIKVLAPPTFRKLSIDDEELSVKEENIKDDENTSMEDITEITHCEEDDEEEHESILPEYFEDKPKQDESASKKRKIVHEPYIRSSTIEHKEALKMFLLSLMPEVEDFTDSQVKQFKRRVFSVIDEITGISYNTHNSFANSSSAK